MGSMLVMALMVVAGVWGEDVSSSRTMQFNKVENGLATTDLVQAFVIFRHGDRTPDEEELAYYPTEEKLSKNIFFPYGTKALTNRGKQRGFSVGKYLRKRYDGFISQLYLPDEITVRTTSFARTKMTALTALAGLYPPPPAQRWNPMLEWQPVPYDTQPAETDDLRDVNELIIFTSGTTGLNTRDRVVLSEYYTTTTLRSPTGLFVVVIGAIRLSEPMLSSDLLWAGDEDDLMYWYNCRRYIRLRNEVCGYSEIVEWLKPHNGLFKYLQEKTGNNITTAEGVFYLDNLFQTLKNVNVNPPKWATEVMPQIKNVTKIEYAIEFYTAEMIRLSSGVLLFEFLNATSNFIAGDTEKPKLHLYSAHENNVAAFMSAARVFTPHQPNYGATFSLELRRGRSDGKFWITAAYARDAGGPEMILPVAGCGGLALCDYDKFRSLVQEHVLLKEEFEKECNIQ